MPIYQWFYLGGVTLTILGIMVGAAGYMIKDNHIEKNRTKSQTELNEIKMDSRASAEALATNPDAAIDREIEIRTETLRKEYSQANKIGDMTFKDYAKQARDTSEAEFALAKAKEEKISESVRAIRLITEPVASILYDEIEKQVNELVELGLARSVIVKPYKSFEGQFVRVQNGSVAAGTRVSGPNYSLSIADILVVSWKYRSHFVKFPVRTAIVSLDGTVYNGRIGNSIQFGDKSIFGVSSEKLNSKKGQEKIIKAIQKEVKVFLEDGLRESEKSKARGGKPNW